MAIGLTIERIELLVLGSRAVGRLEHRHLVADVGAEQAKPSPPTSPAKPSETMSPNMFPATITP